MLNVTLDNNCIIDLEQRNAIASHLEKLIQMHNECKINLRVVAISASERKPDHTYISHLDEFKGRINKIGLGNLEILPTIWYAGLSSFVDYYLAGGGALDKLEREIQGIMFPKIELSYGDFCKTCNLDPNNKRAWQRWVNVKCDVLALWSHIWYKGDMFVTSDEHFHKKTVKPRLEKLGAGKILKPDEAVKWLASISLCKTLDLHE